MKIARLSRLLPSIKNPVSIILKLASDRQRLDGERESSHLLVLATVVKEETVLFLGWWLKNNAKPLERCHFDYFGDAKRLLVRRRRHSSI